MTVIVRTIFCLGIFISILSQPAHAQKKAQAKVKPLVVLMNDGYYCPIKGSGYVVHGSNPAAAIRYAEARGYLPIEQFCGIISDSIVNPGTIENGDKLSIDFTTKHSRPGYVKYSGVLDLPKGRYELYLTCRTTGASGSSNLQGFVELHKSGIVEQSWTSSFNAVYGEPHSATQQFSLEQPVENARLRVNIDRCLDGTISLKHVS